MSAASPERCPKSEYLDGLAAVGFVDPEVRFTHQVGVGMHYAIVQAVKPGGTTPTRTAGAQDVVIQTSAAAQSESAVCCDHATSTTCCSTDAKASCCGTTAGSAGQLRLPMTAFDPMLRRGLRTADVAVVGAGQSGLAAGRALRQAGLEVLIIEAAAEVGGSWPSYYDSLTLFSPARFSALPGMRLRGRPNRYPTRDEITEYLRRYAVRFDLPVRTDSRVLDAAWDGQTFDLDLAGGADRLTARALVAASGGFGRPHSDLPGLADFAGTLLHAARYRRPDEFTGQRVVVVGAGNTAVQVAVKTSPRSPL